MVLPCNVSPSTNGGCLRGHARSCQRASPRLFPGRNGLVHIRSFETGETGTTLRVLLAMDAGAASIPGGHRVQFERTAEALRRLGLHADVVWTDEVRLDGVDVLHGMNTISREAIRAARERGVRVAISPIYWSAKYRYDTHNPRVALSVWRRGLLSVARTALGAMQDEAM